MTFYTFMIRNYINEDTPAGDLAQDMRREKVDFPRNRPCKFDGWHRLIRSHLQRKNACKQCLDTFEVCWEEYVRFEKKRLKRNL